MRGVRAWVVRLLGSFGSHRWERRIDEELEAHLQMDVDDGIRGGLSPEEARRQATLRLGGMEATKEQLRERHGQPWIENTLRDVVYAWRTMRRNRGLTATVVLTLALGIGATTAIFTVVNGVLLRPLPYPDPDRLVSISVRLARVKASNPFAYTEDYPAWRQYNRTLSEIAGHLSFGANLVDGTGAERVACAAATASLFHMLGARPVLGREFLPEEDRPGGRDVAMLEYGFWQGHFAGDRAAIGKTLELDGRAYTIVGVLPPSFRVPDRYRGKNQYDLWVPFAIGENGAARDILLEVVGRMRPGVNIQAVRADLDGLMRRAVRRGVRWKSADVVPWQEQVSSGVRRSLILFLGAVGFVLLIACVNVANLLLSRSAARSREMAVRRALGAGSGRIARQLLTESVLMSLLGAALGLVTAYWTKGLVLAAIAPTMPELAPIGLDYRVLAFTLALAVITGIAFGMAPAIAASRVHVVESLKDAGRGTTGGAWKERFRLALAVGEVALATVLSIGAGLLLRSFLEVRGIDLGVNPRRLLTFNVSLTKSRYPSARDQARYLERLLGELRTVPGVVAVAGGSELPLTGSSMTFSSIGIEGREATSEVAGAMVSPDFFRTMGIPLLHGRAFTFDDREDAPHVAMVSRAFAARYLAKGDDVGHRIEDPFRDGKWLAVVGVVRDVRFSPESAPEPMVYLPSLQAAEDNGPHAGTMFLSFVARTSGPPMTLARAVQRVAAAVDSTQPIYGLGSFEEEQSEYAAPRGVNAFLILSFATLALLLGAIGIYGVLSYAVGERTHEFGIRIAVGARPGEIVAMVLRRGMKVVAAGAALGLVGGWALARSLSAELWGVRPGDPMTFAIVAPMILAAGILACAIPARRAARVEPVVALRCE